ncbi:hypothetical protein [Kitasatospora sp. NPDC059571]|uniref:hypothetical protein n=1 Tax=Kitasatospora sp. NPDC059571 TaxID=3346871 RepID=UPI00367409FC
MTAPAATTAEPGWPVRAGGRPAVVLWALLVTGLLALLPCAGSAKAVGRHAASVPSAAPAPAPTASAGTAALPGSAAATPPTAATPPAVSAASAVDSRTPHGAGQHAAVSWADDPGGSVIWCPADGGMPGPGKGCSSHPFCGPEAQLPNAPPQPAAVALPLLVAVRTTPVTVPVAAPAVSGPAPDLHVLQVQRT